MPNLGRRVIVAGGSLAGLLAARTLSPWFDEVLMIERDRFPDAPEPRKGVPQGRHVHGLLPSGGEAYERLFPGIMAALEDTGATVSDIGVALRWFHFGGYKTRFRSGLIGTSQSRALLEWHVRQRCRTLPNVVTRQRHEVVGLLADPARSAITGAEVRSLDDDGAPERLDADLVVDATGRGSRAERWLQALGCRAPRVSEVTIDVGYTTRLYRRRPGDFEDAKLHVVYPTPPADRRMGVAFPIEGDRWIVTLAGWLGDHAPPDEAGFLSFARSLAAPDIIDLIDRTDPVSGFAVYRFPSNLRRHYEELATLPRSFLALGDALCSFNPIYGQGMAVAALEAEALGRTIAALQEQERGLEALPESFFKAITKLLDQAWALIVAEDSRFPGVTGPGTKSLPGLNWYVGRLHEAAIADPEVYRVFLDVMNLTKPATAVLMPAVTYRVTRHWISRQLSRRRRSVS